MKKLLLILSAITTAAITKGADKDSTIYYPLPDSVKAVSFMAEINVAAINSKKEVFAGISTDMVKLSLEADKKEREVVFEFPETATVLVTGMNVDVEENNEMEWDYNWSVNETYKLLIAIATDSADNFALYSGYIFLPRENKWKLIGTCRINGQWKTIQQPRFFYTSDQRKSIIATAGQVWCQRNTGSWKNMVGTESNAPVINLLSHVDSLSQFQIEKLQIEKAIADGSTDVKENAEAVYYKMMKEGTGASITANDTVVIFYKGYLFNDGTVFDQTKDKPATFSLKRLIRGWQIGVPLCKVGGKIKLVIPSAMAYSIRTRAAKIPPNSILVFEIEVMDVKPAK
jgi:FKBP-type peptidyl-prolyl cis-trans isomerase FkpA